MTFRQGDRVLTPLGPGGVAYQRMAAPDYREAEAVSVVLDARRTDIHYAGTIFRAGDVRPVPKITRLTDKPELLCPRCGAEGAYSYTVEGLDGMFESCPPCKEASALDTLEDQERDRRTEEQERGKP